MRKLLFILLVLTGISNVGYGQIINDDKTSNDSIYEYEDDSDYENNMLELDSLCKDYEPHDFIFIPADYLYKHNWDNNIIHNRIENLTQKPDTTIIPLQDIVGRGFVFPKQGFVTSEFGPRRYHFHYGMDTKLNIGDSVVAAFDGVVRIAAYSAGYGYVVVIRHNNGLETIYGHLSQIIANVNQVVRAGDLIGLGGSTGRSTGPHLHFEVRYLGEPFNPNDIINYKTYKLVSDTLFLTRKNFEYLNYALKFKGAPHKKIKVRKRKGKKGKYYLIPTKKSDLVAKAAKINKKKAKLSKKRSRGKNKITAKR